MAKEKDELEQLACDYLEEGRKLFFENRLMEAERSTSRAKVIFGDLKAYDEYADCLNVLGIIYGAMGNDDLEVNCYLEGLEIAIDHHLSYREVMLYNNVGSKYQKLGANEQAFEFFNKAKKAMDEAGDYDPDKYALFELILNMNLCDMCAKAGAIDLSLEYLEKARKVKNHPANKNFVFSFRSFECYYLWSIGHCEEARSLKDELMQTALSEGFTSDYLENMQDVCKFLRQMEDYEDWKIILEKISDSITEEDGIYLRINSVEMWMDYYKALEDMEHYRALCVKYVELTMKKRAADNHAQALAIDNKVNLRIAEQQRKRATSVSLIDNLTGIGNRNKMMQDSVGIIKDSIAHDKLVGIGLLDIDFFKECNDTYGHIQGDACLKKVAGAIRKVVGDRGCVYRFGGDEFLILLPDISVAALSEIGADVQREVAALQIPNEKSPVSPYVTVSQGYTAAIAEEGDTIEKLVGLADHVLYHVKRYGRNGFKYMRYDDVLADQ